MTDMIGPRALLAMLLAAAAPCGAENVKRITNLYDAFGAPSAQLVKDWGFAALVEYEGRRVLFDTGNHADIFERNVKALEIDLARLDAVVISHRHGDHTSGITYLLKVNPRVTIYVPQEGASFVHFRMRPHPRAKVTLTGRRSRANRKTRARLRS